MEEYIPYKWQAKESWSCSTQLDKIDLKIKKITRDKKEHYIMIKVSIQKEDIKIVNIYASNIEAPPCMRQILTNIKMELENSTIIVGGFNV